MTWPEVASDAVKIGLPLLLGGAVTLFSVRLTRKHGEQAERRRRLRESLEALARAVTRWQEANEDHYLYRKDEYFKACDITQHWIEGNLDTVARMKRRSSEVDERYSLLQSLESI